MRKVNILGTPYTIREVSVTECPTLETCDGYCDWTTKEIVVERESKGSLSDMECYIKKVLRHEMGFYSKGVCTGVRAERKRGRETRLWWIGLLGRDRKFTQLGERRVHCNG